MYLTFNNFIFSVKPSPKLPSGLAGPETPRTWASAVPVFGIPVVPCHPVDIRSVTSLFCIATGFIVLCKPICAQLLIPHLIYHLFLL